jgi:hypothetical protein
MRFHLFIAVFDITVVPQIFRLISALAQQDTLRRTPTTATPVVIRCPTNLASASRTNCVGCKKIIIDGFANDIWFFGIHVETTRQYQDEKKSFEFHGKDLN